MKKKSPDFLKYAIWIDQKKAVIASMNSAGQVNTEVLSSAIESHVRFPGETNNRTRLFDGTLNQEKHVQNHLLHLQSAFMKDVVEHLPKAGSIVILGPAESKYALHRMIEKKKNLSPAWIIIKSAGKMNLKEISAVLQEGVYA